jgi:hypothetical protein
VDPAVSSSGFLLLGLEAEAMSHETMMLEADVARGMYTFTFTGMTAKNVIISGRYSIAEGRITFKEMSRDPHCLFRAIVLSERFRRTR